MKILAPLFIIFILLFSSCSLKPTVLTEKEFAQVYLDSLKRILPDFEHVLNEDLSITSSGGIDEEYTTFTYNAYKMYEAQPDSIASVLKPFLKTSSKYFTGKETVSFENIVPTIKPLAYIEDIKNAVEHPDSVNLLFENYNEELIIAYGLDSEENIRYLSKDDLKDLNITMDSLHKLALQNFDRILPEITRQGGDGMYMLTAGGTYEASLILLESIWTKENFDVDGGFIVAIPARDLLIVIGSEDKENIERLKELTIKFEKDSPYPISRELFIQKNGKFILYN